MRTWITSIVVVSVLLSGLASALDEIDECLARANEELRGFIVPAPVVQLGQDILSENPEFKGSSLAELLANVTANTEVRQTSGASEAEWNSLLTLCDEFRHDGVKLEGASRCIGEIYEALDHRFNDQASSRVLKFERLNELAGHFRACLSQSVSLNECLREAEIQLELFELPKQVVELSKQLQDLNPDLRGLSLVELNEAESARTDVRGRDNRSEEREWRNLMEVCATLWHSYTLHIRRTSCGNELWKVMNPNFNVNFRQTMVKHPKLLEVAGHVYTCVHQIRIYKGDDLADHL